MLARTDTPALSSRAESGRSDGQHGRRRSTWKDNPRPSTQADSNGSVASGGWIGRLWSRVRHLHNADAPVQPAATKAVVESGAAAAGDVTNPSIVMPASLMFSPQRAELYITMASLLVRNPHYISRIVLRIRHHECDALLDIVLDSLFGDPAHEPQLTALFAEIVALEVERTPSIDTVMRNDAPSVHLLSAYLRTSVCIEYLRSAIGPTIEFVVGLGNLSLDPDLATVYQDWARMQPAGRVPLVVSTVEAASYTEVQNLSRRRHGHLVRVARHCLFDIFGAQDRIPAGLTAICSSMLAAIPRRFPEASEAKQHSRVGSMFFLRFVNAALTMPCQYGLLEAPPTGTIKTNLKLVARLIQRMSNHAGKPPDEWPPDARQFMADNIADFRAFVVALTSAPGPLSPESDKGQQPPRRAASATGPAAIGWGSAHRRPAGTGDGSGGPSAECRRAAGTDRGTGEADIARDSPPIDDSPARLPSGTPSPAARAGSEPPPSNAAASRRDPRILRMSWDQPKLGVALAQAQLRASCAAAAAAATHESSGSPGNPASSVGGSVQSMFDMGLVVDSKGKHGRRPSRTGPFGDVTLPLNDLYLLQKFLLMYEDAWAPGEAGHQQKQGPARPMDAPMRRCLAALGPAPPLVRASANHATRIPLE
ncbi:hypothetical protein H4R19_000403 [Coemansia spiralis]|nr:hypothetical protein H4R19_000403 [Coemansia spiralis]